MDLDDVIKVGAAVIGVIWTIYDALKKKRAASDASSDEDDGPPPIPAPQPGPAPLQVQAPVPPADARPLTALAPPPDSPRARLAQTVQTLSQDASALGEGLRQERATQPFVPLLTEWLPERAAALREDLISGGAGLQRAQVQEANRLLLISEVTRELIRQRQDPSILPVVGDADTLADRCYAPIVAFAEAEGLPLSTMRPVTLLTEFDEEIWIGFADAPIAPLFLPREFPHDVLYWPAVAHEVGHDFLLSVDGLRDALRGELGLPNEYVGTRPLNFLGNQLHSSELWRLFGGWFDELFCDVFGTLMCGPAYVATMVELFSHREDPREVLFVGIDPQTGRYGVHPPRHLRVHAGCMILERAGFHQDAKALLQRWHQKNQIDPDTGTTLLFVVGGQLIQLPFSVFAEMAKTVVERLYAGPLDALSGFGLQDISGLDYGPHEHADAERAKASLLSGRVPAIRDARAIISGAVHAALEKPDQKTQILTLARRAIPGAGTFEHAPDAFTIPSATEATAAKRSGALDLDPVTIREALVLREILNRRARTG